MGQNCRYSASMIVIDTIVSAHMSYTKTETKVCDDVARSMSAYKYVRNDVPIPRDVLKKGCACSLFGGLVC